jgi:fumarylacetoacetate (FAA) hydrolase
MKLVTYVKEEREQLGVLINDTIYDMEVLHPDLPNSMNLFLNYWEEYYPVAQAGELLLREGTRTSNRAVLLSEVQLMAPVPFPTSCRDGYAFRQHVAAARRNRKVEMIPEFVVCLIILKSWILNWKQPSSSANMVEISEQKKQMNISAV